MGGVLSCVSATAISIKGSVIPTVCIFGTLILISLSFSQLTNVAILIIPSVWYLVDQFFRIYLSCRPFLISNMEVRRSAFERAEHRSPF